MSRWVDDAIRGKAPKPHAPRSSWWTEPLAQANREAFQRRLVDQEITRMNGEKFGGNRRTHDKFIGEK